MFRDITTLLKDPEGFARAADLLAAPFAGTSVDLVAGIESRGFVFGALLAHRLRAGFVPIRKPGKLPAATVREEYQLEYGTDAVEMHRDALPPGARVLLHDDLLATGGTMLAATRLVERLGGVVVGISFLIELSFLNGRARLAGHDVRSLLAYDAE